MWETEMIFCNSWGNVSENGCLVLRSFQRPKQSPFHYERILTCRCTGIASMT
jgi:hypothetical protein